MRRGTCPSRHAARASSSTDSPRRRSVESADPPEPGVLGPPVTQLLVTELLALEPRFHRREAAGHQGGKLALREQPLGLDAPHVGLLLVARPLRIGAPPEGGGELERR